MDMMKEQQVKPKFLKSLKRGPLIKDVYIVANDIQPIKKQDDAIVARFKQECYDKEFGPCIPDTDISESGKGREVPGEVALILHCPSNVLVEVD